MPKLKKRTWNTCPCEKGEDPDPSCVYHGVGSFLVLSQFTRVSQERHVVAGAGQGSIPADHPVGDLFRIATLCDRDLRVIVPWGREANGVRSYEDQHRALVEQELLEGDGRYNLLSTQLGVDSPTCLLCLRELRRRGGTEVPVPSMFMRMIGEAMHLLRYSDSNVTRCGGRRKVPGPCQQCFQPTWWVGWTPSGLTQEEWDRREGLYRMLRSFLEGFGWVLDPAMGWSHPCLGGRRRVGYRDDRALECQLYFYRREMEGGRPSAPVGSLVSRFERDLPDA